MHRFQQLTHFNDFVVGHAHLTVFGAMIMWMVGGLYYVWPRLTGRKLWSDRLASWHLWLTVTGFTAMVLGLTIQGFIQGAMLENGADFVDSVKEMIPGGSCRTIVGTIMDVALGLHGVQSSIRPSGRADIWKRRARTPAPARPPSCRNAQATIGLKILPPLASWPAIGFFVVAVFLLGAVPWLQASTHSTSVTDAVTGLPINVRRLFARWNNAAGRCTFGTGAGNAIHNISVPSRGNRRGGVQSLKPENTPMIGPICSARGGSARI